MPLSRLFLLKLKHIMGMAITSMEMAMPLIAITTIAIQPIIITATTTNHICTTTQPLIKVMYLMSTMAVMVELISILVDPT